MATASKQTEKGKKSSVQQYAPLARPRTNTIPAGQLRNASTDNGFHLSSRLQLVVDIDHTLVHSVVGLHSHPNMTWLSQIQKMSKSGCHRLPCGMKTFVRPDAVEFLTQASKHFDLSFCTLATRGYAHEVATLLHSLGAPLVKTIHSRETLSLCLFNGDRVKSLEGIGMPAERTVVVDDLWRVWPYNRENVMLCYPFLYFQEKYGEYAGFPGVAKLAKQQRGMEVSSSSSSSPSKRRSKEDTSFDPGLKMIGRVLEDIAIASFMAKDVGAEFSVKTVIAEHRQKVLQGCVVKFVHTVPVPDSLKGAKKLLRQLLPFLNNAKEDSNLAKMLSSRGKQRPAFAAPGSDQMQELVAAYGGSCFSLQDKALQDKVRPSSAQTPVMRSNPALVAKAAEEPLEGFWVSRAEEAKPAQRPRSTPAGVRNPGKGLREGTGGQEVGSGTRKEAKEGVQSVGSVNGERERVEGRERMGRVEEGEEEVGGDRKDGVEGGRADKVEKVDLTGRAPVGMEGGDINKAYVRVSDSDPEALGAESANGKVEEEGKVESVLSSEEGVTIEESSDGRGAVGGSLDGEQADPVSRKTETADSVEDVGKGGSGKAGTDSLKGVFLPLNGESKVGGKLDCEKEAQGGSSLVMGLDSVRPTSGPPAGGVGLPPLGERLRTLSEKNKETRKVGSKSRSKSREDLSGMGRNTGGMQGNSLITSGLKKFNSTPPPLRKKNSRKEKLMVQEGPTPTHVVLIPTFGMWGARSDFGMPSEKRDGQGGVNGIATLSAFW